MDIIRINRSCIRQFFAFALPLLLAMAAWLLVAGCRQKKKAVAKLPRVALVLKTLNNPFFLDLQAGAQQAADSLGVQLIVQAPEREIDVERQIQIVENLIQTRIDALCISPCGSREILPALQKANRAGIPVLIVDTRIDEAAAQQMGIRWETFIGSDNFAGGRLAGEFIRGRLRTPAAVAVLEGIPGHETADSRLQGFLAAMRNAPHLRIVASQPANWERDQGYTVFQNMLQAHPDIRALFACNDMMALGALEAIAEAGKSGRILVVGFDAVEDARRAILEGRMAASVAQFPFEMGRTAVAAAVTILQGRPVEKEIPVQIALITRESMQEESAERVKLLKRKK